MANVEKLVDSIQDALKNNAADSEIVKNIYRNIDSYVNKIYELTKEEEAIVLGKEI